MNKQKVRVTITVDYSFYPETTLEEINEMFSPSCINNYHAYRDNSELGYSKKLVEIEQLNENKKNSAKGLKGVLLDKDIFRIYKKDGSFKDYSIIHPDLSIEIIDDDAVIYENKIITEDENDGFIDVSPETLGK